MGEVVQIPGLEWRIPKVGEMRKLEEARRRSILVGYANKRRAAKLKRAPAWADHDKIAAIYAVAARITKRTGIAHHVDHIIPLQGVNVCGLHVETNLQIIPASENLRKKNKFIVD